MFWVEDKGIFILARHDKSSDTRDFTEIDFWGTHHIWGSNSGGFFSSGVERVTIPTYDSTTSPDSINVNGSFESGSQESTAEIDYDISFATRTNGLRIRHTLTSSGSVSVDSINIALPIYHRECNPSTNKGLQCNLSDATIDYWTGSAWSTLSTAPVSTTKVRVGRDASGSVEYAYIGFDGSETVRLSQVFQQSYQQTSRVQMLQVQVATTGTLAASVEKHLTITTDDP